MVQMSSPDTHLWVRRELTSTALAWTRRLAGSVEKMHAMYVDSHPRDDDEGRYLRASYHVFMQLVRLVRDEMALGVRPLIDALARSAVTGVIREDAGQEVYERVQRAHARAVSLLRRYLKDHRTADWPALVPPAELPNPSMLV